MVRRCVKTIMKILTWLAALFVFVAIAAGTATALHMRSNGTHALSGSHLVVAGVPPVSSMAGDPQLASPSPSPVPTAKPHPAAAPVRAAAPVSRTAGPASIVVRSTQQVLINQDRARYGLRPLTWNSCLSAIAYSNAVRMAAQDYISHTNGASRDLGCHLGYQGGENVGWWSGGVNDTQINSMFMNSAEHKANILGPYHYVATSWVTDSDGIAYIAVEFG
jgi:uncharacterized protein YkwD